MGAASTALVLGVGSCLVFLVLLEGRKDCVSGQACMQWLGSRLGTSRRALKEIKLEQQCTCSRSRFRIVRGISSSQFL